jgi:hypothetical protein
MIKFNFCCNPNKIYVRQKIDCTVMEIHLWPYKISDYMEGSIKYKTYVFTLIIGKKGSGNIKKCLAQT